MMVHIFALLLVVIGFSCMTVWVYWAGNAERMDAAARIPFDDDDNEAENLTSEVDTTAIEETSQ